METLTQQEKKLIFGIPQYEFVLLLTVHICALFTFIGNSAIHAAVGFVAIGCTCLLAFNPYLFLLLPVYMVFYEQLAPIAGLVGYRIYTIIVIGSCVFKTGTKISLKNILMFLFLLLYVAYIVYPNASFRVPMFVMNFLFLVLYYDNYFKEKESYMKFFGFLILSMVFSSMWGFFGGVTSSSTAMMVNGEFIEYTRFLGTFNDPNYFGLLLNISIFGMLCLKYNKTVLGKIGLVICYIALLATLSITAILINIIGLALYFVFVRKLNPVIIPLMVLIVITFVGIYNSALHNDMGFVTTFAYRIDEKLEAFGEGDMDDVTTGRTNLSARNLNTFSEQGIFKILFGGNYVTSVGLDKSKFSMASHNEFVDNLLFFGIVGTILYWFYFLYNFKCTLRKLDDDKELKTFLILTKLLYLAYCCTLTIFPDIRLIFLFFL